MRAQLAKYRSPDLVMVYQPGKVGSTALEASIAGAANVHGLFDYYPCVPALRMRYSLLQRARIRALRRAVRATVKRRPQTRIIVPVRDPAERNVSMFFQDLAFWYAHYIGRHGGVHKRESLDHLIDCFRTVFPHEAADDWLTGELQALTHIAPDELQMGPEMRHLHVSKGPYSCMVIHTDFMRTQEGRGAIEAFTGCEGAWTSTNRGDAKWYAPVYAAFREHHFMREYREQMADSLYARLFFADRA